MGYFDFEVGATLIYGTVKPERIKYKQYPLKSNGEYKVGAKEIDPMVKFTLHM